MARKRKSGDGTIRLRKDGRWEGRIVIGYDDKGLPKTKNVLAKSKTECAEKLKKLKETIYVHSPKNTSDMPFGDWMDFWYQTYCKPALKPYTQTTYEERIYKQIIPKIGSTPLNQITTGTLEKFYAHLKSDGRLIRREQYGTGLSNSVIRSIHAHCRAALEKAKKENLIRKNPAEHCTLPQKKSPEIDVLAPAEMQRLLIQAKYETEAFYVMFLLDLSTGLRRGEVIGLQWDDINLETGTLNVIRQIQYTGGELKIGPPKTKASERAIILPPPLVAVLKDYKSKVKSKWLFPSPVKKEDVPRDPSACRKRLSSMLEKAGCKHVPFHALRHTFATQMLRYGMDVKTLASTIGHESVETTLNIYSHTTDEGMRQAAERIDRAMGAITGVKNENNGTNATVEQIPDGKPQKPPHEKFEPTKGKYRRPGTGSIHQVSKNVWEGRYSPIVNGKRIARNIYANSIEECEEKLAQMIAEMKEEYGIA